MEKETYELANLVEMIKRQESGGADAFQQLYEATKRTTLAVIKRYCDIPGDYEDLLQETYIRVFRSIDTLEDDTKALAWIRKIAANTAIRHNMKKWPALFSEMADDGEMLPEFEDENGMYDPVRIADRKAVSEAVATILDSLPYDQRTALWMIYGQQVTIKEMAASLGISENTIKSRLYQGRQKLMARKDEFRKYGIELTVIPISVLIAMAFDDTVYAAGIAGSTVGATATRYSFSKRNKKSRNKKTDMLLKNVQSTSKTVVSQTAASAVEVAKSSAVVGKLTAASVGFKAATLGAVIVATAGVGVSVNHSGKVEILKETTQAENWQSELEQEQSKDSIEQNSMEIVDQYAAGGNLLLEMSEDAESTSVTAESIENAESMSVTVENIENVGSTAAVVESIEHTESTSATVEDIQAGTESTDIDLDAEMSIDADIKHIRATYAYTNDHIGEYERISNSKNTYIADHNRNGTFFYDGDVEVKCVVDEDGYYVELYEKNPALVTDALPAQDTWPEAMAEFIFAIKDGCEYRIYIKNGRVIRYINPAGEVTDYLESKNLDQFRCALNLDEYWIITQIFNNAFPGWHTAYCGEFADE